MQYSLQDKCPAQLSAQHLPHPAWPESNPAKCDTILHSLVPACSVTSQAGHEGAGLAALAVGGSLTSTLSQLTLLNPTAQQRHTQQQFEGLTAENQVGLMGLS